MRSLPPLFVAFLFGFQVAADPQSSPRVVFLGDSNTYAGGYLEEYELLWRLMNPTASFEFINLGLSSETVSGLSEPVHPFPRPDLHERLARVLEQTKPQLIVACYGMNDGIYYPYSDERFAKFQAGIERLIKAVAVTNAKLVLLTPPPFEPDSYRGKMIDAADAPEYGYKATYRGYNDVLKKYADWMAKLSIREAKVLDLHSLLTKHQSGNPGPLTTDGVHFNATAGRVIGRFLFEELSTAMPELIDPLVKQADTAADVRKLIRKRQNLLRDAWLTATGHKRPGVAKGLPLKEAQQQAAELDAQIIKLLAR